MIFSDIMRLAVNSSRRRGRSGLTADILGRRQCRLRMTQPCWSLPNRGTKVLSWRDAAAKSVEEREAT